MVLLIFICLYSALSTIAAIIKGLTTDIDPDNELEYSYLTQQDHRRFKLAVIHAVMFIIAFSLLLNKISYQ